MPSHIAGKTALITGASSGIGADFARQLALQGCHLILVARRKALLDALADELKSRQDVKVTVLVSDLTVPGAPSDIYDQVSRSGQLVDILINNAGSGIAGDFVTNPWKQEKQVLDLDIIALTEMTKRFACGMVDRRFGFILQVSSLLAFLPTPAYASYAASKAYVYNFSEALNFNLHKHNVVCTTICPGFTATEFFQTAGQSPSPLQRMLMMKSSDVARIGLKAMFKGKGFVVPGIFNQISYLIFRFLPRRAAVELANMLMK